MMCAHEYSEWCVWVSWWQGNGIGRSFVALSGDMYMPLEYGVAGAIVIAYAIAYAIAYR